MTHAADFKLSITKALADQLDEKLATLTACPLTSAAIDELEKRPGVYFLFHRGRRVYVGKAQQPLPTRLRNHWDKLRGREGIDIGDMGFVCLYVDEDLDAAAPEKLLIRKYRGAPDSDDVPWNVNGFGNRDPGRNRDRSAVPANHFDALYPANLSWLIRLAPGRLPLAMVLAEAKRDLPYNLRYERSSRARHDYRAEIDVPELPLTTGELLGLAIGALPPGWQATALPGYVILYRELAEFPSARAWWRLEDGVVVVTRRRMELAPEAEIGEESEDVAEAPET